MSGEQATDAEWTVCPHRVIFGDTDAMGVVYYGTYMRFLEIGRGEYLRARGHTYREIEAAGYAIPVAEVQLRYLAPARYDDLIEIATRVEAMKRASVRFGYRLTRQEDGRLLAKGWTRHACLRQGKAGAIRIPDEVVRMLGQTPLD